MACKVQKRREKPEKPTQSGKIIDVAVTPSSSKNEALGWKDGVLRVKIAAAPENGKANAALRDFLADHFNVKKSAIEIISGEKSRKKRVLIAAPC